MQSAAVALGRITWLSAFSSGNHVVRLFIGIQGFPDASGVTVQPWLTDILATTSQADEWAAVVDAQDSVQKSTPDNFQNNTVRSPPFPGSSA
jgi:hypothetical protein